METEARHFGAGLFAGLQQRGAVLDLDLNAVYFDLGHPVSPLKRSAGRASAPCQ